MIGLDHIVVASNQLSMPKRAKTANGHPKTTISLPATDRDRDAIEELRVTMIDRNHHNVTNAKVWRAGIRALAYLPIEQRLEILDAVESDSKIQLK